MKKLQKGYRPLTATPIHTTSAYREYTPSEALQPYIICFWGSEQDNHKTIIMTEPQITLVTPDTAMDIIFTINYTNQTVSNHFCGVNDTAFYSDDISNNGELVIFAIRFHFWSVVLFSQQSLKGSLNIMTDVDNYFDDFTKTITPLLIEYRSMQDKIKATENYLASRLNNKYMQMTVLNAIHDMIATDKSSARIIEESYTSRRQLERLFLEYTGVTPKKAHDLIRYQKIWQAIIAQPFFDSQEAILKYNFVDQAHFINNFKKYHKMTPQQARAFALEKK